jgi:hypothetical protein
MIVDKAEGLIALERAGIRVARFAYADSAEDAIAFAGRRTAEDERFVPITLRLASRTQADRGEQSLLGEAGIREAYVRLKPLLDKHARDRKGHYVPSGRQ